MRTPPPPLLAILRSQLQGNLLALAYLEPDGEFSLTQAATLTGASVKAVAQEVSRLVEAGLLNDRRAGNLRLFRAVTDGLLSKPLTDLLAVTYGPLPVLTRELRGVGGVVRAYIDGSWAARYAGEAGRVPGDVDVLVVGDPDRDELQDVADAAEKILRREVNIRVVRPETWESDEQSPFLTSVRSRPLLELDLAPTEDETA